MLPASALVLPLKVYALVQNPFNSQDTKDNEKIELISYSSLGLEDIIIKDDDKLTVTLDKYISPKPL